MTERIARDPYDKQVVADQETAMKTFADMARRRPCYVDVRTDPAGAVRYVKTLGKIVQPAIEGFARSYPDTARLTLPGADVAEGAEAYERWMKGEYSKYASTFSVQPLVETSFQSKLTLHEQPSKKNLGSPYIAAFHRLILANQIDGTHWWFPMGATEMISTYQRPASSKLDAELKDSFVDYEGIQGIITTPESYEHFPLHSLPEGPETTTELVTTILDEQAGQVFAQYGHMGLAQHRIGLAMGNICAGLFGSGR